MMSRDPRPGTGVSGFNQWIDAIGRCAQVAARAVRIWLRGEEMMKRVLITTWMVAAALIGFAAVAEAVQPAGKPFIHVSTSPHRLDLGTASFAGLYNVSKALTVQVDSNCLHGPITISATTLRHHMGASIPPKRIFVRTKGTYGFVPMGRPVAISAPTSGSHRIVLDLQVQTGFENLTGRYRGTFTVTVMPPV